MIIQDTKQKNLEQFGYTFVKQIGFGSSGVVRLYRDPEGQNKAIKVISMDLLKECQKEMEICSHLMKLKHQNIVKIEKMLEIEGSICIVMEYCPDGSLDQIKKKLTPYEAFKLGQKILQGITFMHENGIIHRDIKPANILLFRDGDEVIPKLCDFGAGKIQNPGRLAYSIIGTENYIAPEVTNWDGYSFSSDIWSFGVILYELFFYKNPFKNTTVNKLSLAQSLQLPRIFRKILIGKSDRMSAKQLINNVFSNYLSDAESKFIEQKRKEVEETESFQSNASNQQDQSQLVLINQETEDLVKAPINFSRSMTTDKPFQRKQTNKQLQSKLPHLPSDLELKLKRLQFQNKQLKNQNKSVQQRLQNLSNQNRQLYQKFIEAKNQSSKTLQSQHDFLKKEFEKAQKRCQSLESQIIQLKFQLKTQNQLKIGSPNIQPGIIQNIIISGVKRQAQFVRLLLEQKQKSKGYVDLQFEVSRFMKFFNKLERSQLTNLTEIIKYLKDKNEQKRSVTEPVEPHNTLQKQHQQTQGTAHKECLAPQTNSKLNLGSSQFVVKT